MKLWLGISTRALPTFELGNKRGCRTRKDSAEQLGIDDAQPIWNEARKQTRDDKSVEGHGRAEESIEGGSRRQRH